MTDIKLKSCPFCGAAPRYIGATQNDNSFIICDACTACFSLPLTVKKEELIESWNNRAIYATENPEDKEVSHE